MSPRVVARAHRRMNSGVPNLLLEHQRPVEDPPSDPHYALLSDDELVSWWRALIFGFICSL